jgi:hypothetical protein
VRLGEQVGDAVLGVVRVLVLVDEDVAEGLLVVTPQDARGCSLEQADGLRAGRRSPSRSWRELALVALVDVGRRLREEAADLLAEGVGVEQLVLGVADLAGDRLGRYSLGVDVEVGDAALDEAAAVVFVVDREGRAVAEPLRLGGGAGARTSSGRC